MVGRCAGLALRWISSKVQGAVSNGMSMTLARVRVRGHGGGRAERQGKMIVHSRGDWGDRVSGKRSEEDPELIGSSAPKLKKEKREKCTKRMYNKWQRKKRTETLTLVNT